MWRIVRWLIYLAILAGLALIAYAYVGPVVFPADFAPEQEEIRVPVTLSTG